ncbi:hypothetical protein [Robertmurraya sp. FSL R5-0851]|uniref:hypothetical protein n=1 Tax=Robertmurraya sp. FSL R5-0851 TaxID=2921584 RepID=UPI0030F66303
MKTLKKISICLSLLFFTLCNTGYANGSDKVHSKKPMTVEEIYEVEGYTTFKEATKEFEERFKSKIELPKSIPFKVKYKYGKFEEKNSKVTYEYSGEDFSGDFLSVVVTLKTLGKFKGGYTFHTKNGTEVYINENPHPDLHTMLSFKKGNLYYYIVLHFHNKDLEKEKILEIANSLSI